MKSVLSVVLLLALILLVTVPGLAGDGKPAPNFVLKTADGKSVELKKLAGKVVVVNFWATWCGPCRAEIPDMMKVYEQLKGKGLEIVGIALDREGWSKVTPFVEKMKMTYPVVVGDEDVTALYGGIDAIPATFVIDKKGNVVGHHVGAMSKADFEAMIKPYF